MTTPATSFLCTTPIVYRLPLDNTEAVAEFDFEDTVARTLADFPGYAFTADGRALSFKRGSLRPMSPGKADGIYRCVPLTLNKRSKSHLLHRLIARAFIPNPDGKPQVNHLDRDPSNNAVDNLEWVTASENRRHADRLRKAQNRAIRRATPEQLAQAIELHQSGLSIPMIAETLDLNYRTAAKAIATANNHRVTDAAA